MTAQKNKSRRQIETSFEESAISHINALYRTALRMTRNIKDAEDLVQDVYLKAFANRKTFRPGSNMRAWLFKILTNDFISKSRRGKKEPVKVELDEVIPFIEERNSIQNNCDTHEGLSSFKNIQDSDIRRSLEELHKDYRMVLAMALVEEFSYKQIAQILDVPIGTVMSRLHRGKNMLKEKLHQRSFRWRQASVS